MCCGDEKHEHHAHHGGHHDVLGRGMCGCGERRFMSRKERIEMLDEYSESLKRELEGVLEELRELKGE
jgi:hypothetical protein